MSQKTKGDFQVDSSRYRRLSFAYIIDHHEYLLPLLVQCYLFHKLTFLNCAPFISFSFALT
uniref:Uncharacterized protein n=1 Tax=Kuenenia stuttgartiensis TaxID=174633 RepID=Q1PWS2_KUEST|nr:unknown protein [Candidatus Kuenenia stuttgartiensis]